MRKIRRNARWLVGTLIVVCLVILYLTAHGETYIPAVSDSLNVRESPWVGAEITGSLYPDDEVTVVSVKDGWALVEAAPDGSFPSESGNGYVNFVYLTVKSDDYHPGKHTNTSGGRARIRRTPNGKATGWLKAGETITVKSWSTVNEEYWACTEEGYILGSVLTRKEGTE